MLFRNETENDIIHKATNTTIKPNETIKLPYGIGLSLGLTLVE